MKYICKDYAIQIMQEAMHLLPQELLCLKSLVLGQCADWAAFHSKLKANNLTISQSSLDRFFSGKSKSARTLRKLALSIGTTPEALVSEVRMRTHAGPPVASGDSAPIRSLVCAGRISSHRSRRGSRLVTGTSSTCAGRSSVQPTLLPASCLDSVNSFARPLHPLPLQQ